ncbi:hypothetical protein E4T44_15255 [Aureobasidium sp. EXF-8845]|nr:hypothetical protein E4T44_15255 [Aureobasidium sp. EXF-8845]
MATNRRIISQEKTHLDQDETKQQPSIITPAVPQHVIVKLLLFTFAMLVLPISSYFLTLNTLYSGNYHAFNKQFSRSPLILQATLLLLVQLPPSLRMSF